MPELTCFRLLDAESPAGPLAEAVRQVNNGQVAASVSLLEPKSFHQVPSKSFVYWVDERVRKLFNELPEFETSQRTGRVGMQTGDDFRFVRCWWEVRTQIEGSPGRTWWPFAKGGSSAPFFADVHLVVNWGKEGKELLSFDSARVQNEAYFFKPGLTWPSLPHIRGSFGIVPKGCIFGHSGPMVFSEGGNLMADAAQINSNFYGGMLHLLMPRGVGGDNRQTLKYEVGYVTSVPMVELQEDAREASAQLAHQLWLKVQEHYSHLEVSHNYAGSPPLDYRFGHADFAALFAKLNLIIESSPELAGVPLKDLAPGLGRNYAAGQMSDEWYFAPETARVARWKISHAVGLLFGRWKSFQRTSYVPYGLDTPFPLSPPALSLPPSTTDILAEAGMDGFTESTVSLLRQAISAEEFVQLEGAIIAEGFASLADYLARPNGFFADHLHAYSASRRKAPIYWPLSTKSGDFTVWVYYPAMSAQTLPKIIADILSPRMRSLAQEIENRRAQPGVKVAELEQALRELDEMKTALAELLNQGYRPDVNDGVMITAAPLWQFFRYTPWRNNLRACCMELARGDYDWAHLAMSMWPDRVLEVCKKDRSIAIAHGKEELCPAAPVKGSRGRKKATD
jgi:hypothetical protein